MRWYQSALALQGALGFGLLMTLIFLVGRPLLRKFKKTEGKFHSQWTYRAVGLLLGGFIILLIGNVIDFRMTTGTHVVYKVGLIILTVGAVLSLIIPYDLYSLWNKVAVSKRDKVLQTLGVLGLVWFASVLGY